MLAELLRVMHHRPVDEAAENVDALVERGTPLIWNVGGKLRVLDTKLSMKDKTLVLLHSTAGARTDTETQLKGEAALQHHSPGACATWRASSRSKTIRLRSRDTPAE